MANSKQLGLIGIANDVQFGKSGGRLVYDSASASFKATGTDGTSLVTLRVAPPVSNDDVATKSYVDSSAAAGGTTADQLVAYTIAMGS